MTQEQIKKYHDMLEFAKDKNIHAVAIGEFRIVFEEYLNLRATLLKALRNAVDQVTELEQMVRPSAEQMNKPMTI